MQVCKPSGKLIGNTAPYTDAEGKWIFDLDYENISSLKFYPRWVENIKATSISIDSSTYYTELGETLVITGSYLPANATTTIAAVIEGRTYNIESLPAALGDFAELKSYECSNGTFKVEYTTKKNVSSYELSFKCLYNNASDDCSITVYTPIYISDFSLTSSDENDVNRIDENNVIHLKKNEAAVSFNIGYTPANPTAINLYASCPENSFVSLNTEEIQNSKTITLTPLAVGTTSVTIGDSYSETSRTYTVVVEVEFITSIEAISDKELPIYGSISFDLSFTPANAIHNFTTTANNCTIEGSTVTVTSTGVTGTSGWRATIFPKQTISIKDEESGKTVSFLVQTVANPEYTIMLSSELEGDNPLNYTAEFSSLQYDRPCLGLYLHQNTNYVFRCEDARNTDSVFFLFDSNYSELNKVDVGPMNFTPDSDGIYYIVILNYYLDRDGATILYITTTD